MAAGSRARFQIAFPDLFTDRTIRCSTQGTNHPSQDHRLSSRVSSHCDAAVKVKADLDSTTKYVSLQRHLNTLNNKGVVDVVLEPEGFSGQMNQQGRS